MGRDSDNASLNRAPCAASKASLREPLSPESQRLTLSRQAYASVSPYFKRLIQTNWRISGDVDRTLKATRPLLPQGEGVGRSPTDEGLVGDDCCLEPAGTTPTRLATPSPSGEGGPTGRMRAGAKRPFVQLGTGNRDKPIHDVVDILLR